MIASAADGYDGSKNEMGSLPAPSAVTPGGRSTRPLRRPLSGPRHLSKHSFASAAAAKDAGSSGKPFRKVPWNQAAVSSKPTTKVPRMDLSTSVSDAEMCAQGVANELSSLSDSAASKETGGIISH